MDPILEMYQALEEKVLAYNPSLDCQRLRDAFHFADNHHSKQLRRDGTPYITHPLAVADIVADLKLDTDSLIAALLHDCIEDTEVTHEEIAARFGPTVADLVEGVTKLTRVQYVSMEEKQMENLRKMLLAMSKDIRVILVKLCDRLHNMRTMQYQTPKKQREKSLETMEIYAPIAHRLGMQRIKWELEDLSLKYLDPVGYHEIEEELAALTSHQQEFLLSVQNKIKERLDQEGVKCTIYSRIKSIYSIYRKIYTKQKTLSEIFDLYALRVIVDTVADCYKVLGFVHNMFNLVPDRFKDYISTPKPNLYQSLHTTVIGRQGIPFEVQIRTWEMHETAEYGIAAHWKYKQGGGQELGDENSYEWVRRLLESQEGSDAEEFVKSLKVDLFSDEVFVFTPQGDVVSLPAGSTPIDFAYAIHSAVGNRMVGAKVNGRIVTLDSQLHNGDIVEIMTSKNARGPSRDWMKICKSNEARNKIRQWFKRERRDENIANGRAAFESELKRAGYTIAQITQEDVLPRVLKKARYGSLDDLYAAIGYGGITSAKAVTRIRDEMIRISREERERQAALQAEEEPPLDLHISANRELAPLPQKKFTHTKSGVIVEGLENCMVKFAKCCTPVPGDPIIGFVTRGYGVSVHRQDCPNASPERRREEQGRWLSVSWGASEVDGYQTSLDISAKDRQNLFLDVAAVLSAAKIRVDSLIAKGMPDGYALIIALVVVKNLDQLQDVMRKLHGISGVMDVRRSNH
ncbi:MAG TPA: bifunctional (p)ppGpp synthetase/guanosine-3',5'-bis(diphosphate) 3'-pyrophosphohydrolase [Candidatus Onthomonas avicola]|nr:bifunctional (p)ppGpp synthetase/guanosine-3',5'-bis(diphosphate) 3'-pyrophosphohydrolase [Candidatus Onthomonas avicola]